MRARSSAQSRKATQELPSSLGVNQIVYSGPKISSVVLLGLDTHAHTNCGHTQYIEAVEKDREQVKLHLKTLCIAVYSDSVEP